MAMNSMAQRIMEQKYLWKEKGETRWEDIALRVADNVHANSPDEIREGVFRAIADRDFIPGGRYLYASGRGLPQVNNCMLFEVEDSREGWASLAQRQTMALMTGAGTGTVYSKLRPRGSAISNTGGEASGPVALMLMVNEIGRQIMQGGSRRSAIWAGLHWWHPDVFEFMEAKQWAPEIRAAKEKDFNAWAPLDMTNISIILDTRFRDAIENPNDPDHEHASEVMRRALHLARTTGEPGFSIDIDENDGEHLRNACTEVVSRDDNDICNLGSVNWANMRDLDHFAETLKLATWTLVAGTVYSALPFKEVEKVVERNRRIGVGIMGLAEWAATRGLPYDASSTLRQWLKVYREVTDLEAKRAAEYFGINVPVKTRAVAPAGTISIMAETTSGIEPVYAVAYKRRNLVNGREWQASYEIDQAAQRLIDRGVEPKSIPTALNLAEDIEPVLRLLAEVSDYVDQSVSKTVNLPSVEDQERLGITDESLMKVVMRHIFRYRGLTFYPDGARGGQPIVPVSYSEAVNRGNAVFTEIGNEMSCSLDGVCGT